MKRQVKRLPKPVAVDVEDGLDPLYRIAYDVEQCKVGCVLIQAALGGDIPNDLFFEHFPEGWTVAASGCQVYPIRKSQLPALAARTHFER